MTHIRVSHNLYFSTTYGPINLFVMYLCLFVIHIDRIQKFIHWALEFCVPRDKQSDAIAGRSNRHTDTKNFICNKMCGWWCKKLKTVHRITMPHNPWSTGAHDNLCLLQMQQLLEGPFCLNQNSLNSAFWDFEKAESVSMTEDCHTCKLPGTRNRFFL